MELDDANAGLAAHEATKEKLAYEIERVHDKDVADAVDCEFTPEEERRLVRKLDLW